MGTGSALYAVASQNFPLIRIAIGTSDAFPFAGICSTATARGPLSFLDFGLRSPGKIWGRSSCANDVIALIKAQASRTSSIALRQTVWRCKIFRNASRSETDLGSRIFTFDLILGIGMKINDKAPDFTLPDENGKEVSLKDFRGKTVILFFFPRASTPG
jgi:hypothetical protein